MFKDEIEAYLARLRALGGRSEHTVRAYRSDLTDFARFLEISSREMPDGEDVVTYADHLLRARRSAPRTVRRRIACLRGFCRDLARRGVIERTPFDGLELALPRPRSLPRALGRSDARLIVKRASLQTEMPNHELVAVAALVMLSVGLRVSELVALRRADFDPEDGTVRVHGKGQRERTVFIVDKGLRARIEALPVHGERLFARSVTVPYKADALRADLRRFAAASGVVRRVTPHMLRHTAATLLLEDGVDLLFLQRLLGHQDISTTALYAHVADTSLRRALERAPLLQSLAS